MRATLYVIADCKHCAELRTELAQSSVAFEEIDVGKRRETIPELLKLTKGRRVVPVLVDDDGVHVAPRGGSAF
jgi:glutaredoxin